MKKCMKELQRVDLKLAAWNKLCLYDVKIFLQNLDIFFFLFKLYNVQRLCFSHNIMIEKLD